MPDSRQAMAKVIGLLDDVAVQIRELEREAEVLLHEQGDPEGSAANLRRKAELLRDLPEALDDLFDELDERSCSLLEAKVDSLSARGAAALAQNSPFWMKNLLYPDDYEDGQSNELEAFTAELAGR